jgi:putative peptidoglycan lipid II flippase
MTKKKDNAVKTISLVMVITLVGKLLGLFRDRLLTINYGSGMATNAFLTASRIPRVFFDAVFASAISASFIPIFNEYYTKKGKDEANKFAGNFVTVMALLCFVITLLGITFSRQLVILFADGYDAETSALCIKLTRMMFPTVLFTGVAYSFVGILQSYDEFNMPAFISVVSNGIIIIYFYLLNDKFGIFGLAVAYLLGWFMQTVILVPSLVKKSYRYRPSFSFRSEGMKKVFALMLPVMVSTWVQPINQTINSKFGSRLFDGAGVSAIELSNNLYLIIVGVFVLSVTNVIFPKMSRLTATNEKKALNETIRQTVHASLYFVIPMMFGLMALAQPLIDLIYGGGEFDAFSVQITSKALVFVSLGMIGYAIQSILCRVYFAEQNGKLPLIAGIGSIAVNIVLCKLLMGSLDVSGLAIASAVASTIYAILLILPLQIRGDGFINKRFLLDLCKTLISAVVMAGVVLVVRYLLTGLELSGLIGKLVIVAIPAVIGVIIYFILTVLLRLEESQLAINTVKKIIHKIHR